MRYINKLFIASILLGSIILSNSSSTLIMDSINLEEVLEEDRNRDTNTPMRYAVDFDVDINLFEAASTEILDNGDKIWTLHIQSSDAIGMKLHFDQFYLPEGSNLLIYNNDMVVGPLTSANNHEDQQFGHKLIKGDQLTLEYYQPYNTSGTALINISKVFVLQERGSRFANSNTAMMRRQSTTLRLHAVAPTVSCLKQAQYQTKLVRMYVA